MPNPIASHKLKSIMDSLSIELDGEEVPIKDIIGIDFDDETLLAEQPLRIASFGIMKARAHRVLLDTKLSRESTYAEAFQEAKYAMDARTSDAKIEAVAKLDDLYLKAKEDELAAQEIYDILSAIVDGLQNRSRMLSIIYGKSAEA